MLLDWAEFFINDGEIKGNTGGTGGNLFYNSLKLVVSGGKIDTLTVYEARIMDMQGGLNAPHIERLELLRNPAWNNYGQVRITGALPAGTDINIVCFDAQSNQVFDRRTLYGQLGTKALLLGDTDTNKSENYLKFKYDGNTGIFGSDGKVLP
jgi:hypothetical protein